MAEASDSSVEKTVAPIMHEATSADEERRQPVEEERSSEVLIIEVPADMPAKPLKEGVEIVSPNSLSSEQTRSVRGEETPRLERNEELVKEPTLSEEILERIVAQIGGTVIEPADATLPPTPVADVRPKDGGKTSGEEVKALEVTFPEFLQDSVVPLLQYLDKMREKYAISKELGFYVELIRNMMKLKRSVAVKREWESATELPQERAAILEAECAAVKVALKERESQLREKEVECEVLQLNIEKEAGRCAELEETCVGLRASNENVQKKREKKYLEELATVEARRAEEVCIAEELRGKIAEAKTAKELGQEIGGLQIDQIFGGRM
ncbi:hypothetical protein AXG93_4040s1050 [Marchantia polymorpha subsp. ruderalis]|uniref:Uncharacterized protein n=1 Tax=Marchantia polymorpha subsp. ruderalis TaxID=1480154 RepID=A0A176VV39_MARPO|nr:hypothetical protein AXG93_4040s1050 [Marchantia polymorpha subsp. ruderalis]